MSTFNGWQIISLPTSPPAPKSIEWEYMDVVGSAQSPFSLQRQIQVWGAAQIRASISYPLMPTKQAAPWRAFLALANMGSVFSIGDPLNQSPQHVGATGGTVSGSGQTGFFLSTSSSNLTPGDWIQIGLRLYLVTSVAGGYLGIWPQIRESPASGSSLIITNTTGLFRLMKNQRKIGVSVENGRNWALDFEIEEAI